MTRAVLAVLALAPALAGALPVAAQNQSAPRQREEPRSDQKVPLTASEVEALKHQLMQCWQVPEPARRQDGLAVQVQVRMNPDATVRSAVIVDRDDVARSPLRRDVADSAVKALKSQACSPLVLPPNKFRTWQEFTFSFDPKDAE
jgi:hypothetical protein